MHWTDSVFTWTLSCISHIIKTVPQFSVYSHSDNNESKVIRILAFLCDALLVLCFSFCPYSLVTSNCDRRKICWSSISSDIRQRRTVRTCAAALNNLSTAAELASVVNLRECCSQCWTWQETVNGFQLGSHSLIFTLLLVECHWSCKWLLNNTQQSGMSRKLPPVKMST